MLLFFEWSLVKYFFCLLLIWLCCEDNMEIWQISSNMFNGLRCLPQLTFISGRQWSGIRRQGSRIQVLLTMWMRWRWLIDIGDMRPAGLAVLPDLDPANFVFELYTWTKNCPRIVWLLMDRRPAKDWLTDGKIWGENWRYYTDII